MGRRSIVGGTSVVAAVAFVVVFVVVFASPPHDGDLISSKVLPPAKK